MIHDSHFTLDAIDVPHSLEAVSALDSAFHVPYSMQAVSDVDSVKM